MDEFAQTRGVDDLFDDEIVPLPAEEVEIEYHSELEPEHVDRESTHQRPTPSHARPPSQPLASRSPEKQQQQHQQQQQRGRESPSHAEAHVPAPQESNGAAQYINGNNYRSRGSGRGYSGERGRGRGRGQGGGGWRGGRSARSLATEERCIAPTPTPAASGGEGEEKVRDSKEGQVEATVGGDADGRVRETDRNEENGVDKNTKEQDTPAPRTFAVKGDRSGTGGVKKPKLTENELTERMKAAKLKAAERAAAHARAEADEASFLERERVAAEKRREEMQNRHAMNNERERNRRRKLEAQTRREWDVEKSVEAFASTAGRGRGSYRRGAHGAVANAGTAPAADGVRGFAGDSLIEHESGGYFRGRGSGRGNPRRARGGRGRGDYFARQMSGAPSGPDVEKWVEGVSPSHHPLEPPRVNEEDEFPALPTASGVSGSGNRNGHANANGKEGVATPLSPQGSWAEQVEMTQAQEEQQQSLQATLSSMTLEGKREGNS
ncbi:conserved hypothetical protein [Histoplasma capsulatum var. duboisii H88]|uniref:Uncharacterized protein n=1 Tax=Ajellomyces capsulatus (strain H88) TaxID=544711 RepID=F0UTW4_AJEC8|nr:conserved hypothetical protein [Histoplasma capsulatum var. duboisii H88]